MSGKNINIKLKAETKDAESKISKFESSLNSFSKKVKKNPITKLGASFNPLIQSLGFVVSAAKKAGAAIKEFAETAQVQIKAEKQLESAAKNNPYLSKSNIAQLKDYASKLQSIGTIGDESLLPLMAQLAAAGRTQNEIQDIMSAALDVSASGAMSLESAVKNLNKTYSGLSGELGETIPELKNLTAEQLKNGDAVKIVKDKYKGMAEESASATGGITQMKNSLGDLKEILGTPFAEAANSFGKAVSKAIDKVNEKLSKSKKAYEEYLTYVNANENAGDSQSLTDSKKNLADLEESLKKFTDIRKYLVNGGTLNGDVPTEIKDAAEKIKNIADQEINALKEKLVELRREAFNYISGQQTDENGELEKIQNQITEIQATLRSTRTTDFLDSQIEKLQTSIELERKRLDVLQKQKDLEDAKTQSDKDNAAAELAKANYELAIKNYDEKIAKQKELGKQLSDEEVLRGRINVMEDGLLAMVSEGSNHISWSNYQVQNEFIPAIQKAYEELYALQSKAQTDIQETTDQTVTEVETKAQTLAEKLKSIFSELGEGLPEILSSISSTMTDITSLVEDNTSATLAIQTAKLDELYEKGALSYEEYTQQIEDAQKEAAETNYNAALAEWAISLAQAIANVAQGVTKAYAAGSYINGTLLAAAGAVQIAAITASKPQKPSFAQGGIVPGSSYYGDNVQANVNSGEMILTARQQKTLWNLANGNSSSGLKQQVFIQNYASNKVSAETSFDNEKLIVSIKEIVNSEMEKGSFRNSMQISNTRNNGVKVL